MNAAELHYFRDRCARLPVPEAIKAAVCHLELLAVQRETYPKELQPDVRELHRDHVVSVVAHHNDCIKPHAMEFSSQDPGGKAKIWSSSDIIAGIMWNWCAWTLMWHRVGVETSSRLKPLLMWPTVPSNPEWKQLPQSWKIACIAARQGLLHPERFRQHSKATTSRGINEDGFVLEQRRSGRTTDMLLKAVMQVADGGAAVIEAHDRQYSNELRRQAMNMVMRLDLDPDRSFPAIMSRQEMSTFFSPGTFSSPRQGFLHAIFSPSPGSEPDDSLHMTHYMGTDLAIRILRDHYHGFQQGLT